jgi:hypothetical protein
MTPCKRPSLDQPLGRSKDGRLHGKEWLGLGHQVLLLEIEKNH